MKRILTLIAAVAFSIATTMASAATLTSADFSGGVFGVVKPPFNGLGVYNGLTFTGSVVFDSDLTPGAGSGFVNVALPDDVPNLSFSWDSNTFEITALAFMQFNNGVFNGFAFSQDFNYLGTDYTFSQQGGVGSVSPSSNPAETLVATYINIGRNGLTNIEPFAAEGAVPEASTWVMLILGFAGVGFVSYGRRAHGRGARLLAAA